ncbi:MAG: pyridoxal phosphate-dependent aminotransferase [Planctomycetota bacterium]|nr:MAG: pyridoxal phosphate-dependent aminotransferase [Planctomycetota bacterium]
MPLRARLGGESSPSVFRPVPQTGVIFVTEQARRHGYRQGAPGWANLGQGQPETGPLPGAPPRVRALEIETADQEYAPTQGLEPLREAIAHLYNELYRKGKRSKYTAANVCVSGGGRIALARAAAALGPVHLGHFLPDYTAYEELLEIFRLFTAIPIALDRERAYDFEIEELGRTIRNLGLGALLLSNPCNPTGKLLYGDALERWVRCCRSYHCALLIDEYYSHYIWNPEARALGPTVSAAAYVEDVDEDDVLIFDGLTKNWRYPGWRIGWILAPRRRIEAIASAASFLDGGASRPMQRAAIELLDPERTLAETRAIAHHFADKRAWMVERLQALGFRFEREPDGTFYCWVSVDALPPPLDTGFGFFRRCLERKVITVPGLFFDVNPGKRRPSQLSHFGNHMRISFGPAREELARGLDAIETLIRECGG